MQRVSLQEILTCSLGTIKFESGLAGLFADDPAGTKQTQHLKSPLCPFISCAVKSWSFQLSVTGKR